MTTMKLLFPLVLVLQGTHQAFGRTGHGTGGGSSGGTDGTGTGGTHDTTDPNTVGRPGDDTTDNTDTTGATNPNGPDVIPVANGLGGQSPLGRYTAQQQAPFQRLTGDWRSYFFTVDGILEATPTPTTKVVGKGGRPGQGVQTVFDQPLASKACEAWSTLSEYCGGAGTACACYSSAHYVPDQWNTLAAYCAQAEVTTTTEESSSSTSPTQTKDTSTGSPNTALTDQVFPTTTAPQGGATTTLPILPRDFPESALYELVQSAASYTTFCPTEGRSTVAFGAITSKGSTTIIASDLLKLKILTLVFGVVWLEHLYIW